MNSGKIFKQRNPKQIVTLKLTFNHLDRVKRIWYLSPMRAAKVQASLRIRTVSPEPSLLAHTSSESRGTFRQKARSLAPLNGWACVVKVCHDGMLEDTNSLDGAHLLLVPCSRMCPVFAVLFIHFVKTTARMLGSIKQTAVCLTACRSMGHEFELQPGNRTFLEMDHEIIPMATLFSPWCWFKKDSCQLLVNRFGLYLPRNSVSRLKWP